MTQPRRPAPQPPTKAAKPQLPDWMVDPPAPQETLGDQLTRSITDRPTVRATRRAWWRWRERERITDRYPVAAKLVIFFLALALCIGGFMLAYYLLAQANEIPPVQR